MRLILQKEKLKKKKQLLEKKPRRRKKRVKKSLKRNPTNTEINYERTLAE